MSEPSAACDCDTRLGAGCPVHSKQTSAAHEHLADVTTLGELSAAVDLLRAKYGDDFPVWSYNDGCPVPTLDLSYVDDLRGPCIEVC